jgi:hypothetical protein
MPTPYLIDPAHHLVITRGRGVLSDADLIGHSQAIRADPQFTPDMHQLSDLRFATGLDVSVGCLNELVQINPFGAGARRAIVTRDDVIFGLSRMYEMMREDGRDEVQVFRELDEAIAWLGLEAARPDVCVALDALSTETLTPLSS